MSPVDPRIAQVLELLRAERLPVRGVRAAGQHAEIAVIEAPARALERLSRLAPAIKAFGFRYVSMDLAHVEPTDA